MQQVLIVEDQPDNRRIMRDVLARAGYRIFEATTGPQGLEMAQSVRPDLILMDVQLPEIDGNEVTRILKADAQLRSIPIIVVTSYALSGDDIKAFEAGCDAYITKPFSPRHLLATVTKLLTERSGPAAQ